MSTPTITAQVGLSALSQYLLTLFGGAQNYNVSYGSQNGLNFAFTSGSNGVQLINQVVQIQGTLAASSNVTIDINAFSTSGPASGALLDPNQNAYNLTKLKLLVVQNLGVPAGPVESDTLIFEPGGSDAWIALLGGTTPTITLYSPSSVGAPPGTLFVTRPGLGYPVIAASTNNIKLVTGANSGTVTFQILIMGATA